MPFYFNRSTNSGISTNSLSPSGPGWETYQNIQAFSKAQAEKNSVANIQAPGLEGTPTTPSGGIDLEAIRARLSGVQDTAFASGASDIDRQSFRASEQSRSDLVARGLAGTTVGAGMEAGIAEQAAGAKGQLQSDLQSRTDDLMFRYSALAQQSQENQSNRDVTAVNSARQRMSGGGGATVGDRGAPLDGQLAWGAPRQPKSSGGEGYGSRGVILPGEGGVTSTRMVTEAPTRAQIAQSIIRSAEKQGKKVEYGVTGMPRIVG